MAIANLSEIIQASILRRNQLQFEVSELSTQKQLLALSQGDTNSALSSAKAALRDQYKEMFDTDPDLRDEFANYTEIPEFQAELDKLTARFQEELEQLAAQETAIDAQMTTNSAELTEIDAYLQQYKQYMTSNIQEDFNFGLS
ncbi:MAG: hypothetical protein Q4E83_07895 [bacterium]|nr:hypothetical protein [bacterium]